MGRLDIVPQVPNDPLAFALAQALGDTAPGRPSALAEALAARQAVLPPTAQSPGPGSVPKPYALPGPPSRAPALQTLMLDRLGGQGMRPAEMAPMPPQRPAPPPMEPRQQTRRFEVQTPSGTVYEVEAPDEQAAYQAVQQMEAQRTPSRLDAFRQENPAYANVPDAELADALHRKFYADMPRADFDRALGMASSQPVPEQAAMGAQPDAAASRTGSDRRSLPTGQAAPGAQPSAPEAQQLRGFKVQTPSGAVHEVEALDEQAAYEAARQMEAGQGAQGSDYERIMVALRNADAAGDTTAATRLAQMARAAKARQTPQAGGNAGLIEVEGPEGTIYEFPAGTDNATIKAALQKVYGAPTAGQGFGNNVAQAAGDGLFFGFGDEISARLNAMTGYDANTGSYGNWGTTYADQLAAVRGQERQFREDHPVISTAAEVGGSLIGPAKVGTGFIRNGATGLSRIGRSGLVGAATAAGYGFGEGEGEGDVSNRATQAAVSAALGAVGGAAIGGLGEGFGAAIGALRSRRMPADTLPTIEGLKAEAGALYEAARQSGAVVPESTVKGMASNIGTKLKAEGFDKMLHPRVNAVLQRLSSESGEKSLADLEILRRVAAGAANSIEPDERRLASMVLDGIDDAVEGMGGDAAPLKAAREVWSRMRRMETIETAIEKASLQDDFASGLRSQFKTLLRNPRRLRGFAEADIAAMRAIAKGEGGAGLLSSLGRRLSPGSITGLALTGGAGFGGAGFGAAAIPATGMGMKRLGDALTAGSARKLSQRVGMDSGRRALVDALAGPTAPLAPLVVAPGLLAQTLFQHRPRQ